MTARMKLVPRTQTAEERYAWLQMEARVVLKTLCVCGHPLSDHSRVSKPACKQWSHKPSCKCKGFDEGGGLLLS